MYAAPRRRQLPTTSSRALPRVLPRMFGRLATAATLALALVAMATPAQADGMLDLVTAVGGQETSPTGAGRSVRGAKRQISKTVRKRLAGSQRKVRVARSTASAHAAILKQLSRAERGSGRIDVIDASGPASYDGRPAIEPKRGL